MRTLIQSERTVVPPVTAERSPPDSRMTGADSPVMADSLTEAMPSMTSPSEGMSSPASTSTMSSTRRSSELTDSYFRLPLLGSVSRLAFVSVRVRRIESACALPRPSATASAKLANSTVNHNQKAIWPLKKAVPFCVTRSRRNTMVTTAETTSVTKMTGLRISVRGLSLAKASTVARRRIAASKRPRATAFEDMWDNSVRRPCRRASGSARRRVRAQAPGNTGAGRG